MVKKRTIKLTTKKPWKATVKVKVTRKAKGGLTPTEKRARKRMA
jgi:hypothetical protein